MTEPNGTIIATAYGTLIASNTPEAPDGEEALPELWVNTMVKRTVGGKEQETLTGWLRRRNLNEIEAELFKAVKIERDTADASRTMLEQTMESLRGR